MVPCGSLCPDTQALSTLAGAAAITYAMHEKIDQDGVEDRAFRLKFNHVQNRLDRTELSCAAAGAAVGMVLAGPRVRSALSGAVVGVLTSIVAHAATQAAVGGPAAPAKAST